MIWTFKRITDQTVAVLRPKILGWHVTFTQTIDWRSLWRVIIQFTFSQFWLAHWLYGLDTSAGNNCLYKSYSESMHYKILIFYSGAVTGSNLLRKILLQIQSTVHVWIFPIKIQIQTWGEDSWELLVDPQFLGTCAKQT